MKLIKNNKKVHKNLCSPHPTRFPSSFTDSEPLVLSLVIGAAAFAAAAVVAGLLPSVSAAASLTMHWRWEKDAALHYLLRVRLNALGLTSLPLLLQTLLVQQTIYTR